MVSPAVKLNFLLIGNPGVGKSTILNALIGSPRFKAGITFGPGLTEILHAEVNAKGVRFIDTPGLSDFTMRERAAQEIKKSLEMGGIYRIFFVITLEDGRIRPDDKTTMKLVLDAADKIQCSYSVIVNKLKPPVMELLQKEEEKKKFIALLNKGLPGTNSFYFNENDKSLDGKVSDSMANISLPFTKFLTLTSPCLKINVSSVKELKIEEFDKHKALIGEELQALEKDKKYLAEVVAKQAEGSKEIEMAQVNAENEFKAQLTSINLENYIQQQETKQVQINLLIAELLEKNKAIEFQLAESNRLLMQIKTNFS